MSAELHDLDSINPERVDLLADALFSGRFPKGQNYLAREVDGVIVWCCIGVGSRVCRVAGAGIIERLSGTTVDFDGEEKFFPSKAMNWYGFTVVDPWIPLEIGGVVMWDRASAVNDTGPGYIKENGSYVHNGYGHPEPDFTTTIAPAFRRLAQMARDYQAEHPEET